MNTITEMKNTLEGISSTLGATEPQKAPVSQSNLEGKKQS